jgi:UDP-N-acetylmuramyl pentapeptide phosphotransferase/UDP-N-acetylglucosamine-1-phosphate transferase
MLTSILVALLITALTGAGSYWLSNKFWSSSAANKTNGDFGTPRGGFLSILGGAIIGMYVLVYVGKYWVVAEHMGAAMIAVLLVGAVAGFIPLFRRPRK